MILFIISSSSSSLVLGWCSFQNLRTFQWNSRCKFSHPTQVNRGPIMLCPAPHKFVSSIFSFQAVPYNGLLFWCGEDFLFGLDPYNSGCGQCFQMPLEWNTSFGFHTLGLCNGPTLHVTVFFSHLVVLLLFSHIWRFHPHIVQFQYHMW